MAQVVFKLQIWKMLQSCSVFSWFIFSDILLLHIPVTLSQSDLRLWWAAGSEIPLRGQVFKSWPEPQIASLWASTTGGQHRDSLHQPGGSQRSPGQSRGIRAWGGEDAVPKPDGSFVAFSRLRVRLGWEEKEKDGAPAVQYVCVTYTRPF